MDHGDMNHGDRCSMNMLFTWSTDNLCIVFRGWHVRSTFSLLISLILIVLLCAGYEAVRELSRRYEAATTKRDEAPVPRGANARRSGGVKTSDVIRAALYAVQVFYSFFIMLLFMTYNGWVMLAVAIGAFVGHILFGLKTSSTKTVACH